MADLIGRAPVINGTSPYDPNYANNMVGSKRTVKSPHFKTNSEELEEFVKHLGNFCKRHEIDFPKGACGVVVKHSEGWWDIQPEPSVADDLARTVLDDGEKVITGVPRVKVCVNFVMNQNGKPELVGGKNFLVFTDAAKAVKKVVKAFDFGDCLYVGDYYLNDTVYRCSTCFPSLPAIAKPFRCWRAVKAETGEIVWICLSMLNGAIFMADDGLREQMKPMEFTKFGCSTYRFAREDNNDWTCK